MDGPVVCFELSPSYRNWVPPSPSYSREGKNFHSTLSCTLPPGPADSAHFCLDFPHGWIACFLPGKGTWCCAALACASAQPRWRLAAVAAHWNPPCSPPLEQHTLSPSCAGDGVLENCWKRNPGSRRAEIGFFELDNETNILRHISPAGTMFVSIFQGNRGFAFFCSMMLLRKVFIALFMCLCNCKIIPIKNCWLKMTSFFFLLPALNWDDCLEAVPSHHSPFVYWSCDISLVKSCGLDGPLLWLKLIPKKPLNFKAILNQY